MNPVTHDLARARLAELIADADRARLVRRLRTDRRAARRAARQASVGAGDVPRSGIPITAAATLDGLEVADAR
jgi:hypothetical protein